MPERGKAHNKVTVTALGGLSKSSSPGHGLLTYRIQSFEVGSGEAHASMNAVWFCCRCMVLCGQIDFFLFCPWDLKLLIIQSII